VRFSRVCVSLISVPCTVIKTRAGVRHLESASGMKNGQSAAWTTSYRSARTLRRASMILCGMSRMEWRPPRKRTTSKGRDRSSSFVCRA
jgi:hypothetical protein